MLALYFELIDILKFTGGILLGAIVTIFSARVIEPYFEMLLDALKNNTGILGKFYNAYSRGIGRFIFLKRKTRHIALQEKGIEYKIYNINGNISSCRSDILRLDQNRMGRIQGEMNRNSPSRKNYKTYFKGFLKNNGSYLIWEERYKDGEDYHNLTAYYKLPQEQSTNIVGVSIEERNNRIINCVSILSFTKYGYPTLKNLLNSIDASEYLDRCNIQIKNIDDLANEFHCKEI